MKRSSGALYEKPKINVHHHHHVHFVRYFLSCVPLSIAIHIFGVADMLMILFCGLMSKQSGEKAQTEEVLETESLSGLNFSYIYFTFQAGFAYLLFTVYTPRGLFYMVYLMSGTRIKRLHWYITVKSVTFFLLCVLAIFTLLMTFIFSTMLMKTFGTGLAYMMILFMVPTVVALCLDLYLCITANYYLEERIWQAQPKVQHKRKHDDESETPVKTELLLDLDDGQ
jgi:hypothetical protein